MAITSEQTPGGPVRAPAGYDPRAFPPFAVTVDVVVLTVVDDVLHLPLIRRAEDPFAGWWALPGGFKRPGETLDEAAVRELGEEAGLAAPRLAQFGAYGDPDRDPRMDVVSVGYYAALREPVTLRAGGDAADVRWAPVVDVLDGTQPLAFDHARIVVDARDRLADDLERTDAVLSLLPREFTLSALRRTYEAVWRLDLPAGRERDAFELDRRNFRRQLAADPGPFVEATGRSTSDLPDPSRPGRPAAFHRATSAWREASPVRRPRPRG
jgi:8-oxo-dGTP diphosphatase